MTIVITNTPTTADSLPTVLWNNIFASGTLTASSEATGYLAVNAIAESTYNSWKPTALPAWIKIDYGSAVAVDSAALIAHNCYTNGNTVQIQSSTDNSTWTTRATITPTDNTTILALFSSVTARYWRWYITNGTVPNIGVAMAGARLSFPAGVKAPYTPVWLSQTYQLLTATTIGGQFLGNRVIRQGGSTQINLVAVDRTFGETTLAEFRAHYNLGKAFVFASAPSVFSKDVGYCWRKENSLISPTFDENGIWMSVGMDVYAYGDS